MELAGAVSAEDWSRESGCDGHGKTKNRREHAPVSLEIEAASAGEGYPTSRYEYALDSTREKAAPLYSPAPQSNGELMSWSSMLPPAKASQASFSDEEESEARREDTTSVMLTNLATSTAGTVVSSISTSMSCPPNDGFARSAGANISTRTTRRSLVYAPTAGPVSRRQTSVSGDPITDVAQAPADERSSDSQKSLRISHSGGRYFFREIHQSRAQGARYDAEIPTATATACEYVAAGGPLLPERPRCVAAAFGGGRVPASDEALNASCADEVDDGCDETRRARTYVEGRRRAATVPQGFSLAHIPAGFLWGRPRLGALRLLYKKTGNPDRLLLLGPNFRFAVVMFFIHVRFEEELWLFAGGVTLSLVTLAAFVSTVVKDPGLPLEGSFAGRDPQLRTSATERVASKNAWRPQLQQRVRRGRCRLRNAKANYVRRWKLGLMGDRTRRRAIYRQMRLSNDDNFGADGSLHRRDPHIAGSRVDEERKSTSHLSSLYLESNNQNIGRTSLKGLHTNSQSGESDSSGSNNDDSNEESDRSSRSSVSEAKAGTSDEMEKLTDGTEGEENSTSDDSSLLESVVVEVKHNEGVEMELRPAKRLLRRLKYGRKRCIYAVRAASERHKPRIGAAFASHVGDPRALEASSPRAHADISTQLTLYRAGESAVKLRVPFKSKMQHARRGRWVRRVALFSTGSVKQHRVDCLAIDGPATSVEPIGYSAVPAIQHPPFFARQLGRKYGRSRVSAVRRSRELVEKCTEDDANSLLSRFCVVCKIAPPPGAYHCEECRVCIEGYDHHCLWTGKCVGKGNTREFYTWIVFTLLTVLYFGIAMSVSEPMTNSG